MDRLRLFLFFTIAWGVCAQDTAATQDTGTIQGTVRDSSGAIVNRAQVTATSAKGVTSRTVESKNGSYALPGLAPDTYRLSVRLPGFDQKTALTLQVAPGKIATAEIILIPAATSANLTVTESTPNQISVDPSKNADALVLNEHDIEMMLPEDPDDLAADLIALAGPSAGLSGDQIFVDGFITGRLPPKDSIREIRINSNPFSAEFDKIGFGRIQIFTKPGSDKLHGKLVAVEGSHIWNTPVPFLAKNPPYNSFQFGGNASGPIGKRASFFFDYERRKLENYGVIIADVVPSIPYGLGAAYASHPLYTGISDQSSYHLPALRENVSPRFDITLDSRNTLSARYAYLKADFEVNGVAGFSLPSQAFLNPTNEHTVQVTETAVLNTHVVNEARFQYDRIKTTEDATNNTPIVNVANSFTAGGGSGFGHSYDIAGSSELRDYMSVVSGRHAVKFGIRWNTTAVTDYSELLFHGQYNFLGGNATPIGANGLPLPNAPTQFQTATENYAITQQLLARGIPYANLRQFGYGPTQYLLNLGNPLLQFTQMDFGAFVTDDFRIRPNMTISYGLRWEGQTNIHDQKDIGPRIAISYSPKGGNGLIGPKTVLRAGWGIFYDRFFAANVINAFRYNGSAQTGQLSYIVRDTSSYPEPPPAATVAQSDSNITYLLDNSLHAPYLLQTAVSMERQLASKTNVTINFTNTHGAREFRVRDINAPVPQTFSLADTAQNRTDDVVGQRPRPGLGHLYNFESTGKFRQTQLILSVNSAIGRSANLFVRYTLAYAKADTDGLFTFPANQYDFTGEYARSALDVRHNFYLGGYANLPYGLRVAPIVLLHSGPPFNPLTGTDLYQVGTPTSRPGLAGGPGPGIVTTRFGNFDPIPKAGEAIAARNGYEGPGYIGINLRLSRTWGFGGRSRGGTGGSTSKDATTNTRFPGGVDNVPTSEKRYSLTFTVNIRNILNHENLNSPIGTLTSPYFGQGLGTTGAYATENTQAEQRRSDLQLRFSF